MDGEVIACHYVQDDTDQLLWASYREKVLYGIDVATVGGGECKSSGVPFAVASVVILHEEEAQDGGGVASELSQMPRLISIRKQCLPRWRWDK